MILTGLARLGQDAVVRNTPKGDPVTNLSLAFNYGQKGGDGKRPAQWIDASLWGKRAEALEPYLKKGTSVVVVLTDPHIEEFDGRGGKASKLVARVAEIELAGGSSNAGASSGSGTNSGARASNPNGRPGGSPDPSKSSGGNGFNDFEDDIPF